MPRQRTRDPISPEQRKRVIDLWMTGLKQQQIAAKLNISTGSVSNIVATEKAVVPDLQELRELNLNLRRTGITIEQASEDADLARAASRDGSSTLCPCVPPGPGF